MKTIKMKCIRSYDPSYGFSIIREGWILEVETTSFSSLGVLKIDGRIFGTICLGILENYFREVTK